jgi:hypothetical protein
MRPLIALICLCLMVTGCGIKRPLIAPKDIPEYEHKREEKLKKRQIETPVPEAALRMKAQG